MSNYRNSNNANLNRDLFALTLDPAAKAPMQAQLCEALRGIVLSNSSHAGARLPASRTLAAELSVSRTTVQAAYDQIVSEGYLTARRGSGTYVADDITHLSPAPPRAATTPRAAQPWRPFQTGLPDQALLPHRMWARRLERAWRAPEDELLAQPDPLGWRPLREAIADHLAVWRRLPCDADQVVITSGAWEAFEVIFRGLVAPGATVAVEDPCWPKLHDILSTVGAATRSTAVDADGFDPAKISSEAGVAIVTPSRHYPTGRSLPLSRRIALRDWALDVGGLVIEDDYDSEFRYRGQPLPSLAGLDGLGRTIYLGSFSKLVSNALRIGYLVLPKELAGAARAYLSRVGTRASLVPQPALATFMRDGDFATHLRRMRRIYARRQAHLIKALAPAADLIDVRPDPSGMHLFVPLRPRLSRRVSDREVSDAAQRAGLRVGALSTHSVLAEKPQGLLLGYSAFDEAALSDAARRLIDVLRALAGPGSGG